MNSNQEQDPALYNSRFSAGPWMASDASTSVAMMQALSGHFEIKMPQKAMYCFNRSPGLPLKLLDTHNLL